MFLNALLPQSATRLLYRQTGSPPDSRGHEPPTTEIALQPPRAARPSSATTQPAPQTQTPGAVTISMAAENQLDTLTAGHLLERISLTAGTQRARTKSINLLNSLSAHVPLTDHLFTEKGCKTLIALHQLKCIDLNACAVDTQGNTLNAIDFLCEKAGRQVQVSNTWNPTRLMIALKRAGVSSHQNQYDAALTFTRAESSPLRDRLYAALLHAGANPFAGTPPLVARLNANTVVALVTANFNRLLPPDPRIIDGSKVIDGSTYSQTSSFIDQCITDAIARDDVALFNAVLNCSNTHPDSITIRPLVHKYIIARSRGLQPGVCNAIAATRYELPTTRSAIYHLTRISIYDLTNSLIRCSTLFCRTVFTHLYSLSTERNDYITCRDLEFTALLNELAQHGSLSVLAELLNSELLTEPFGVSQPLRQPLRIVDAHELLNTLATRSSTTGRANAISAVCNYIRQVPAKDQTGMLLTPVQVAQGLNPKAFSTLHNRLALTGFLVASALGLAAVASSVAWALYPTVPLDCDDEETLFQSTFDSIDVDNMRDSRTGSKTFLQKCLYVHDSDYGVVFGKDPKVRDRKSNNRHNFDLLTCGTDLINFLTWYPQTAPSGALQTYTAAYQRCLSSLQAISKHKQLKNTSLATGISAASTLLLTSYSIYRFVRQWQTANAYKQIGQQLLSADV